MSHLKLMKLMYLAERGALLQFGHPITFDTCVSMPHGPVLSSTLNLMHGDTQDPQFWDKAISPTEKFEVELIEDPGVDSLSEAEIKLIEAVFAEHGKKTRWQLRDYTHTLDEWEDPGESAIKIEYKEILKAGSKTEAEINSILEDIEQSGLMETYMGI